MELEYEWDPWRRRWLPPSADQCRIALWCTKQVNIVFYQKTHNDGESMTSDPLPDVPTLPAHPRWIQSVQKIHRLVTRECEGVLPKLRIYGYDFPQDLHSIILCHGTRCLKQRRYVEGEERRSQINAGELIWDGEDVEDWSELSLLDDTIGGTEFVLKLIMHHEETEPVAHREESEPVTHHEELQPVMPPEQPDSVAHHEESELTTANGHHSSECDVYTGADADADVDDGCQVV